MSHSRKHSPEEGLELDSLSDRFRNSLTTNSNSNTDTTSNTNKPDFRELDLRSPVSPLRPHPGQPTTSSSSSSSGSFTGRNAPITPGKKSDSGGSNSHSGELCGSVESSPTSGGSRAFRPGHTRSDSGGSQHSHSHSHLPLIYSGSNSVTSPANNVLPTGNICPSGKIFKTGMATRSSKPDVLGSGSVNYGHGSIMRGGGAAKSSGGGGVEGVFTSPTNLRAAAAGDSLRRGTVAANVDPEELKRAGNEQYRKGHLAEALSLYDKAIAMSPGNATYRYNRAVALTGMRRLSEAVRECEEAIRLDSGYVKAHHRLGSLLLRLGQVENARRHTCFPGYQPDANDFQKLQEVEMHLGKCSSARRVGDWKIALRECDAAIAAGADASPQLHTMKAEAFLKLQRLDDAEISLSSAPKFEMPTASCSQAKFFGMLSEAYLFFVRAQFEMAQGRFENAVTAADKAGNIDPRNVEVSVLLSNVRLVARARSRGNDLFKSERYTEACTAYGEGLRLDASNSVLYCNRAACWYKLRLWERSVDDCSQALRIQPNYIKALLRRAASYSKLERWIEAVQDYEILRRELPNDAEVAESLFNAQVSLKKLRGEDDSKAVFGGKVELVSGLNQFKTAVALPGASVVLFKSECNPQYKQISPFFDTLCSRYPSINYLKVDVDESPAVANAENVKIVPTFKIYKNGSKLMEMVCPSQEMLESSVRHYSF